MRAVHLVGANKRSTRPPLDSKLLVSGQDFVGNLEVLHADYEENMQMMKKQTLVRRLFHAERRS